MWIKMVNEWFLTGLTVMVRPKLVKSGRKVAELDFGMSQDEKGHERIITLARNTSLGALTVQVPYFTKKSQSTQGSCVIEEHSDIGSCLVARRDMKDFPNTVPVFP